MIDIENELYTKVREVLNSENVEISSVYTDSVAKFPFVFFEMINNSIYTKGISSKQSENFAEQTFEISIYTNGQARKTDAKFLASIINNKLGEIGFRRLSYTTIPNFKDISIFRIVLRYTAIVSDDKKIYN